jgi:hypothetical protein
MDTPIVIPQPVIIRDKKSISFAAGTKAFCDPDRFHDQTSLSFQSSETAAAGGRAHPARFRPP